MIRLLEIVQLVKSSAEELVTPGVRGMSRAPL